jgi:hypothetical protein
MATCEHESTFEALDLPAGFEELEGLLRSDIQAIVAMLTQRAHERLFLTRREHRQVQARLWNGLVGAINESVAPLTVETR